MESCKRVSDSHWEAIRQSEDQDSAQADASRSPYYLNPEISQHIQLADKLACEEALRMGVLLDEQEKERQRRQLHEDDLMMRQISHEEERADAMARQNQRDAANDCHLAKKIQAREHKAERKQLMMLQRQRSRQMEADARMSRQLSARLRHELGDKEPASLVEQDASARSQGDDDTIDASDEAEFEKLKLACSLLRGDSKDEENTAENYPRGRKIRATRSFGARLLKK